MKQSVVNLQNVDLNLVRRTSTGLQELRNELMETFPDRDGVINQIILALLAREHVLIWGEPGTAKSLLAKYVFRAFVDAKTFEIALTKFSTEASVFGSVDTKTMTETGHIQYWLDEGIVLREFAFLDEFLRSNDPLLSSLLGVLNERLFQKGTQVARSSLLTAIATTNEDPQKRAKTVPELQAVIDRFLFISHVDHVSSEELQLRMLGTFLNGNSPSVTIPLADLKAVSGIVVDTNLLTEPVLIRAYLNAMNTFRKTNGRFISDRTLAKLTQILEAQALFYGRTQILPEDILAVRYGVCDGADTAGQDEFIKAAKPAIAAAEKQLGSNVGDVQDQLLAQLASKLPATSQTTTPDELIALARTLADIEAEINKIVPQTDTVKLHRDALLGKITKKRESLSKTIFGVK